MRLLRSVTKRNDMLKRLVWCVLFVVCVLAVEWLMIAADYKDSVFLGTYHLEQGDLSSILVLRTDQTFRQELTRHGRTQSCHGRWRRTGESVIAFSKEFVPLAGQELGADGTAYGLLSKSFGLFPAIALAQSHVLWYRRTDPSQGSTIAGTYAGDEDGEPATLILLSNETFHQTVTHAGQTRQTQGTWSRRKNGDVLLSNDFLKTSGESLTSNERAVALNLNGSYLQIEIGVKPTVAQPVFWKRMLVR